MQDQVVYDVGYSKLADCPETFSQGSGLYGYGEGCLSQQRWDDLNALFQQTGYKKYLYIYVTFFFSFLP